MVKTNITLETFENIIVSLLKEKGYDTEIVTWNGTGGPEHRLARKEVEKVGSGLSITISIKIEVIYNHYMKQLSSGKPPLLDDVVDGIISDFESEQPTALNDIADKMNSWDWVKDKLVLSLYNTELHKDYLKNKVYETIDDLALTPRIFVNVSSEDIASTLIDYHLLKDWGVTREDVMQQAKISAPKLLPLCIVDTRNLIFGIADKKIIDINNQKISDVIYDPSMYAITTNLETTGASIFYEGVLDELSNVFGGFFFIIPSSLCEVLVMPGDKSMSPEELSEMIKSVNNSNDIIKPKEILANHGYVYYHGKISAYI